jgi:hypothetical protein
MRWIHQEAKAEKEEFACRRRIPLFIEAVYRQTMKSLCAMKGSEHP